MPSTAASLRASADQAERDAGEAIDIANALERHYHFLENRLTPILDRHTAEVWQSQAANESRLRLYYSGTGSLGRARTDLWSVIVDVRRRAEVLETLARDYRREANRLDALAAEAAAAAALIPEVSADAPSTTGPEWSTVPIGVR